MILGMDSIAQARNAARVHVGITFEPYKRFATQRFPVAVIECRGRIQAFTKKALCEAKVHSSWINPDPDYEAAVARFVDLILDPAAYRRTGQVSMAI